MRIRTQSISIAFVAVLFGLLMACSKPSDNTITKDVQTKVAADPDTMDSQVNVAAKDGKITLTGQVETPAAQQNWNRSPGKNREFQALMMRLLSSPTPHKPRSRRHLHLLRNRLLCRRALFLRSGWARR